MLATTSRPTTVQLATAELSTEPSVTFELEEKRIVARLIVSFAEGAGNADVAAPLITIPGPFGQEWTVIWILERGPHVTSATFRNEPNKQGITIPASVNQQPLPQNLHILQSEQVPDEPTKWRIKFKNEVSQPGQFNCDVAVIWNSDIPISPLASRIVVIHDPTIMVASEPIDG